MKKEKYLHLTKAKEYRLQKSQNCGGKHVHLQILQNVFA